MSTLVSPDWARDLWRDAPPDEGVLDLYLIAAEVTVLAYAPHDADGYPLPEDATLKLAIVMQARNLWNSAKASPAGDFDGSGFGLSTMPLDWQIKQLLRPQRGVGAII